MIEADWETLNWINAPCPLREVSRPTLRGAFHQTRKGVFLEIREGVSVSRILEIGINSE
jgi:hypothetical protein